MPPETMLLTAATAQKVEKRLLPSDVLIFRQVCSKIEKVGIRAVSCTLRTARGKVSLTLSKDENANISLSLQKVR